MADHAAVNGRPWEGRCSCGWTAADLGSGPDATVLAWNAFDAHRIEVEAAETLRRQAEWAHPNQCRYCARPLTDQGSLFCGPPARCREANGRKRAAVADVVAGSRTDPDRPGLLDRDPIDPDPDQIALW